MEESSSRHLTYNDAVSLVTSAVKEQFKELQTQLASERDKTADILKKKLNRVPEQTNLQYEGNKKQFQFNMDLKNDLDELLDSGENLTLDDVEDKIKSMKQKLEHRNKLIKIADSSPGGWTTVAEYEKGNLGDDSDDERKIRRAEVRATKNKRPLPRFQLSTPSQVSTSLPPEVKPRRLFKRQAAPEDTCFRCGRPGHWRQMCPLQASAPQAAQESVRLPASIWGGPAYGGYPASYSRFPATKIAGTTKRQ